jgi:hypothetical protein
MRRECARSAQRNPRLAPASARDRPPLARLSGRVNPVNLAASWRCRPPANRFWVRNIAWSAPWGRAEWARIFLETVINVPFVFLAD